MAALVRVWVALAAIGAALCHLSLVFDSPVAVTVVLTALALAEFGWGVITFARASIPLPRVAIVVGLLPTLVWVALLVVAPTVSPRFLPMATASLLGLAVAVVLAVRMRSAGTRGAAADAAGAGAQARPTTENAPSGDAPVAAGTTPALVTASRARPAADATGFAGAAPRHPSPALHALGVLAGVLVIGAIVTPALAASGLYLPAPDRPTPTISHHG